MRLRKSREKRFEVWGCDPRFKSFSPYSSLRQWEESIRIDDVVEYLGGVLKQNIIEEFEPAYNAYRTCTFAKSDSQKDDAPRVTSISNIRLRIYDFS